MLRAAVGGGRGGQRVRLGAGGSPRRESRHGADSPQELGVQPDVLGGNRVHPAEGAERGEVLVRPAPLQVVIREHGDGPPHGSGPRCRGEVDTAPRTPPSVRGARCPPARCSAGRGHGRTARTPGIPGRPRVVSPRPSTSAPVAESFVFGRGSRRGRRRDRCRRTDSGRGRRRLTAGRGRRCRPRRRA